jgi:hypothetical protein
MKKEIKTVNDRFALQCFVPNIDQDKEEENEVENTKLGQDLSNENANNDVKSIHLEDSDRSRSTPPSTPESVFVPPETPAEFRRFAYRILYGTESEDDHTICE